MQDIKWPLIYKSPNLPWTENESEWQRFHELPLEQLTTKTLMGQKETFVVRVTYDRH